MVDSSFMPILPKAAPGGSGASSSRMRHQHLAAAPHVDEVIAVADGAVERLDLAFVGEDGRLHGFHRRR